MSRTLSHSITNFTAFYEALVEFVKSGKSCYSVRDKKEYKSWMDDSIICMSGKDRKYPSIYDKKKLETVFELIRKSDNINTELLKDVVQRERSPILALMVASGGVVEERNTKN